MRGRVAAVLLFLSLLSVDSSGQCRFTSRYSGQYRSTIYDVAVDGNYLWTATGYGVQLLQATPRGPELLDAVALPGPTRNITANVGMNIAYAGSGSRLFVLRRNGDEIEVVRGVDAPDTINDIVLRGALFVATRNGIAHYLVFDAASPTPSGAALSTSRANVIDLEVAGTTLYAADGDGTVEYFNISITSMPQRTGALDSVLRATAVHTGPDTLVYVSDDIGQNTQIFAGTASLGRVPYGSTSFAATTSNAIFIAGSDRTLRAVDLTRVSDPVELFEQQLALTGGSSNAIFDLERTGSTLYVAAGDTGLVTYDVSMIAPPYPLISYPKLATTSALVIAGSTPKAYFTDINGSINETNLEGGLPRAWNKGGSPFLHDSRGGDLLISNDKAVELSSMSANPTFRATFRTTVAQAFMLGTDTIVARLADGSVWTVHTSSDATPQRVDTGGALMSYLTRSGTSYALAEVNETGTTVIHLPLVARKISVEGAATGGLAMNSTHAAFFTFRGLNLVDLSSGAVSILPDSTGVLPRQLLFAGNHLLVLGERRLTVWDTTLRTLIRDHLLPANAAAMHAGGGRVAVATDEGTLILDYLKRLPLATAGAAVNRYYTKALTGRDRLYLFGSDGVDIYETVSGIAPHSLGSVHEPGLVDVAATQEMFFTLGGDGTVTSYSRSGVRGTQTLINEGADTQVLSIFSAGDAVWVAISKGCFAGACQKRTLVLDPRTLAVTASLEGAAVDVTVAGTRAYALLDLPSEIAAFDIANPLQPVISARVAAPATAKSIAFGTDRVLVLGDKLYKYTPGLVAAGEDLAVSTATQQQIRVSGNCAIVIGRSINPALYDTRGIGSASGIEVPSTARSIAAAGDSRVYVLTEHSIEVWTIEPVPSRSRRRSVR